MRLKDLIEKHVLVALDLEMTGTDCEKDRIIEIGAVKYRVGNSRIAGVRTMFP